jgi:dTDP-4-dehydrorhamnose reductase
MADHMRKRILILGGTGMLGHVLTRYFIVNSDHTVYATTRSIEERFTYFPSNIADQFIPENVDMDDFSTVIRAFEASRPDTVINCIGIIKQLPIAKDPLTAITINAQLPHRIARVCDELGIRMIHVSTDCVFDGKKGMYTEDDPPNAEDIYGRTKLLGEVDYPHCVTLRTSIIGHELKGRHGLIEWFLNQTGKVKGYTNAIYTGFPTIELAKIIDKYVLSRPELNGLYHVSSEPISKFELLRLVAGKYHHRIDIEPFDGFIQDRSLRSDVFKSTTGYTPPDWHTLVDAMHSDYAANVDQYYS